MGHELLIEARGPSTRRTISSAFPNVSLVWDIYFNEVWKMLRQKTFHRERRKQCSIAHNYPCQVLHRSSTCLFGRKIAMPRNPMNCSISTDPFTLRTQLLFAPNPPNEHHGWSGHPVSCLGCSANGCNIVQKIGPTWILLIGLSSALINAWTCGSRLPWEN